jgi:hypothetical protein
MQMVDGPYQTLGVARDIFLFMADMFFRGMS